MREKLKEKQKSIIIKLDQNGEEIMISDDLKKSNSINKTLWHFINSYDFFRDN